MDVLNLEKWGTRRKKVVENGIRLVIRRGETEDEWEIALSHPKEIENDHHMWFHRSTRRTLSLP